MSSNSSGDNDVTSSISSSPSSSGSSDTDSSPSATQTSDSASGSSASSSGSSDTDSSPSATQTSDSASGSSASVSSSSDSDTISASASTTSTPTTTTVTPSTTLTTMSTSESTSSSVSHSGPSSTSSRSTTPTPPSTQSPSTETGTDTETSLSPTPTGTSLSISSTEDTTRTPAPSSSSRSGASDTRTTSLTTDTHNLPPPPSTTNTTAIDSSPTSSLTQSGSTSDTDARSLTRTRKASDLDTSTESPSPSHTHSHHPEPSSSSSIFVPSLSTSVPADTSDGQPLPPPSQTGSDHGGQKSFLSNKPAVIGTFTALGVVLLVILGLLLLRASKSKRGTRTSGSRRGYVGGTDADIGPGAAAAAGDHYYERYNASGAPEAGPGLGTAGSLGARGAREGGGGDTTFGGSTRRLWDDEADASIGAGTGDEGTRMRQVRGWSDIGIAAASSAAAASSGERDPERGDGSGRAFLPSTTRDPDPFADYGSYPSSPSIYPSSPQTASYTPNQLQTQAQAQTQAQGQAHIFAQSFGDLPSSNYSQGYGSTGDISSVHTPTLSNSLWSGQGSAYAAYAPTLSSHTEYASSNRDFDPAVQLIPYTTGSSGPTRPGLTRADSVSTARALGQEVFRKSSYSTFGLDNDDDGAIGVAISTPPLIPSPPPSQALSSFPSPRPEMRGRSATSGSSSQTWADLALAKTNAKVLGQEVFKPGPRAF